MEPSAINSHRVSRWCFVVLPALLKRDQEWLGGFREGGGVDGSGEEGKAVDSFDMVLYCSSPVGFIFSGTPLFSLYFYAELPNISTFQLQRIAAMLPFVCTVLFSSTLHCTTVLYYNNYCTVLYLSSFERYTECTPGSPTQLCKTFLSLIPSRPYPPDQYHVCLVTWQASFPNGSRWPLRARKPRADAVPHSRARAKVSVGLFGWHCLATATVAAAAVAAANSPPFWYSVQYKKQAAIRSKHMV